MNIEYYNNYYNSFTIAFALRLNPDWGLNMEIYPFSHGAVIVVKMKKRIAHSLEINSESTNLGDALKKTSLFKDEKISPIANKVIGKTTIGIYSITRYVIFKNDNESSWSEKSAHDDVDSIIEKIKEKYGKEK